MGRGLRKRTVCRSDEAGPDFCFTRPGVFLCGLHGSSPGHNLSTAPRSRRAELRRASWAGDGTPVDVQRQDFGGFQAKSDIGSQSGAQAAKEDWPAVCALQVQYVTCQGAHVAIEVSMAHDLGGLDVVAGSRLEMSFNALPLLNSIAGGGDSKVE